MNIVETPRFEKLNPTLAIIIFDYSSEEDNDYKSVPLNISKHNGKRRIYDLNLYKNHSILLKKLHIFIGKHDSHYICPNCLNSYTDQSEVAIHKRIFDNKAKSIYIPCEENHVQWDKFYRRMPIYSIFNFYR